jgi:hypothetical protein
MSFARLARRDSVISVNAKPGLTEWTGIPPLCDYRKRPCERKPTHELLWDMTCICNPVWFFCQEHTHEILREEKEGYDFACLIHDKRMNLVAVNPL